MESTKGSIHLVIGPMFSGKSTELQRLIRRCERGGQATIAIKPKKDDRYSESAITTHDQVAYHNVEVATKLAEVSVDQYQVIGVEEGQFFPDLDVQCDLWANQGKTVIVAALDATYERQPFPNLVVQRLLSKAETVNKLQAVCHCGANASFTQIKNKSKVVGESKELIGGDETYESVCRNCFH